LSKSDIFSKDVIGSDFIKFIMKHTLQLALKLYKYVLKEKNAHFLNPIPHRGRPFWPSTSLHANFSKSVEGKVS
jgi:hypothetical protein